MTDTPQDTAVDSEIVAAFQMMWDSFPHPVMLLKKTREVVAANKAARDRGVPTKLKCFQLGGRDEIHEGCKANQAIDEGIAQRTVAHNKETNRVMDAYWLPVAAGQDLYLHFAINIDLDRST